METVETEAKTVKRVEDSTIINENVALTNDINEKKNQISSLQKCLLEEQQKFQECDKKRESAENAKIEYSNRFAGVEKERNKLEAENARLHSSHSKEMFAAKLRTQEIAQEHEELQKQVNVMEEKRKEDE